MTRPTMNAEPIPSRRWRMTLLLAALACLALWDATNLVCLAPDATTGREGGCYTLLEIVIGVKHPNVIRLMEFVIATAIGGAVYVLLRRRKHGPHETYAP